MKTQTAALIVKRTMPFPPEVLFRAFSDPKVMSRWFFGGRGWSAEVTNDFHVGRDYTINMRSEKGNDHPHTGTYKEIVPGEKIVFTWNSDAAKDSVVTLVFRKVNDGTELTLTHEFLTDAMRPEHDKGWNTCLDNLELALRVSGK